MTDPVYRLSDRKTFFNSHPHKEDDMFVECLVEDVSFSTHILTRRMTTLPDVPVLCLLFQLTSSQGGWLNTSLSLSGIGTFQLTSSQGGWPRDLENSAKGQIFNSHPHKEDDMGCFPPRLCSDFSTHILTRRMTEGDINWQPHKTLQLTSSQGGWQQF